MQSDHEFTTDLRTASHETPNSNVTTASSQDAAATVPRKKVLQDGKKAKPRSADKSKSAAVGLPKLPFEFADQQFSEGVFMQIYDACSRVDGFDGNLFTSMMSVLKGQKPKDHFELMHMNQMSGVNALVMKYIGYLAKADSGNEIETLQRTLNMLVRTFINQMEVLQRYRSRVEQKVMTVQNVSVSEGGQAIVGNVTQNAHDDSKAKAATTPAAITDARTAPMPIVEQSEQRVSAPVKRRPRQ